MTPWLLNTTQTSYSIKILRLNPVHPERLPWVFISEPNLFIMNGVDIRCSLQSPSLLAPNNLCLLAKWLCLAKGLLTEPVGYPAVQHIQDNTLTGSHLTFTNMACVLSMFLCQPQFLVHSVVTVVFILYWDTKVTVSCLAHGSWLLMHNDLKQVFGQLKKKHTMSYLNCGRTVWKFTVLNKTVQFFINVVFLVILCWCCSDFCFARTDFIEIKKRAAVSTTRKTIKKE